MKIAFIVGQRLSDTGGGNKIVTKIVNELARRGKCDLLMFDFESRLIDRESLIEAKGKDLDEAIKFRIIGSFLFKRNPFSMFYRFIELVQFEKPDLIIDTTGPTLKIISFFTLLIFLKKKERPKYVFFDHSPVKTLIGNSKLSFLYSLLAPLMYRRVDIVASVSRELVATVARDYELSPEKTVFIHNPIDEKLINERSAETVKHEWFNQKDVPIIITACRLDEIQKNVPLLLRSFSRARKETPCRLVVVGAGPQEQYLKELSRRLLIEEYVWFVGYDPNPYKYIKKSKVFILSTKFEALPLVLGEAMACGCPVISSDCDFGPREVLEGGKDGILVPVGDEDALTEAILKMLKNEKLRQEYIQKGLDRVKQFSMEKIINEYEEMFHRALSSS